MICYIDNYIDMHLLGTKNIEYCTFYINIHYTKSNIHYFINIECNTVFKLNKPLRRKTYYEDH